MNKNVEVMVMEVQSTFVRQTKMFEPQVKVQVASGRALKLAVHGAECVLLFLIVYNELKRRNTLFTMLKLIYLTNQ